MKQAKQNEKSQGHVTVGQLDFDLVVSLFVSNRSLCLRWTLTKRKLRKILGYVRTTENWDYVQSKSLKHSNVDRRTFNVCLANGCSFCDCCTWLKYYVMSLVNANLFDYMAVLLKISSKYYCFSVLLCFKDPLGSRLKNYIIVNINMSKQHDIICSKPNKKQIIS